MTFFEQIMAIYSVITISIFWATFASEKETPNGDKFLTFAATLPIMLLSISLFVNNS